MNSIFEFFNLTFRELKLPTRWITIILVVFVAFIILLGYENLTGHFYILKIEKKIELLKELQSLANEGIENNSKLKPIYESTIEELSSIEVQSINSFIPSIRLQNGIVIGKAISGALLWIFVVIFSFVTEIQKYGKVTSTAIGVGIVGLIIGGIFAWIGILIPTLYNPWVNYISLPILQFVIMLILTRKTKTA